MAEIGATGAGFVFKCVDAYDSLDRSGRTAGDINGDGVDDTLIGAYNESPNSSSQDGSSYVVFGNDVIFKDGFE